MKLIPLLMLACSLSAAANNTETNDNDPIRNKITFEAPAFPSNEDGDVDKLYLTYITPDGKRHNIVSNLPLPLPADAFAGGDIEEEDVNFDGIPDLQVSAGYFDSATGHNPMYMWFVWDAKKHQFVEVEEVLINPSINVGEKTICSHLLVEGEMTIDTYKWQGLKLVQTDTWTGAWTDMDESEDDGENITTDIDHDEDDMITKVTVIVKRDGQEVQRMETTEWLEAGPTDPTVVGAISRHDINFDGHPDIQVYLGQYSNLGLDFYDAWLWSPKQNRYVKEPKYHEIPCPEVNTEKKWIESNAAISFSKSCYLRYEWKKGKLVLTKRVEQ